jgi:5-(hydroxymethyl)furfural/furfural oxidase
MPLVEFNFLDDERDMARMMLGFRRTAEILAFPGVARLCGRPFPVRFTDRLRRLNRLGVANAIASRLIASLLDLVPGIADRALVLMTSGTTDLASLAADDERLADHIRRNVAGTFHVSGTCRMGRADDPAAVTDPSGQVRGIDGLRVADASVMPALPRANTNIPVIMVAEKLADQIARACVI